MRWPRGAEWRTGVRKEPAASARTPPTMDHNQVTPVWGKINYLDASRRESRKKLKTVDTAESLAAQGSPQFIPRVLDMSSPSPSGDNRTLLGSRMHMASFDDDNMSVSSKVFTDHTSLGSCANAIVGNPGATPAAKRGNLAGKLTRQVQHAPDDFYSTDRSRGRQQALQHFSPVPTAAHVRQLEGAMSASSSSSVATIHREESYHKALSTVVESASGSRSTDGVRVALDTPAPLRQQQTQQQQHEFALEQQQPLQQQQQQQLEEQQQQKLGIGGAAQAEAPTQTAAASDRNLQRKISGESHKATAERSLKRAGTADSHASSDRQLRAATTANTRKGQGAAKRTDSSASSPRNMMRNPAAKQRSKDTVVPKAPSAPQWSDVYGRLQPNPTGQKNVSGAPSKVQPTCAEQPAPKSALDYDAASRFVSRHTADAHAALKESSAPSMRMDARTLAEFANHAAVKETSAPLAATWARTGDGHHGGGDMPSLKNKRTPRSATAHARPPTATSSSSRLPRTTTDHSDESRTAPSGVEGGHVASKENAVRQQDTSALSEANVEPSVKAPETVPERKENRYNLVRSGVKTLVTQEHNIKGGVALHAEKIKAQVEKGAKTAGTIPSTSTVQAISASAREGEQKALGDLRSNATQAKLRPVVPTFSPDPRASDQKSRAKKTISQMRERRRKVPKLPEDNYEISPRLDSDQEEKQMKTRIAKKVPDWTCKFETIATRQQDIDPDTIFAHKLPSVNLELVFGKKLQRKRTSSVVWDQDQLTCEEIYRYKADMNQDQRVTPRESWHPRDGKSGLKNV
eukprot:GEMP01004097.1.p1 GENE.GEMP01004097.1~~GEMP01004097.1.p1  ORF type:complete len:888 (+),score=257.56 GEMP01004097.1:257-2665(+)